jgi:hypothetical protein
MQEFYCLWHCAERSLRSAIEPEERSLFFHFDHDHTVIMKDRDQDVITIHQLFLFFYFYTSFYLYFSNN